MKKIERIEPTVPQIKRKKKVAAYARVSMETDRLSHSLSAQVSYYSQLIQKNPEWEYAGVYADSFISGTSTKNRTEFQRLIADCEAGKIDVILTKSISRFARNTVDLLSTVRRLKAIGVEVRFEKENISSTNSSGEIMLSILASFAQEESINISNNTKWGTRKRFEQGIPNGRFRIYGYRWEGDQLVVVSEEAAIVKRIFQNFLDGKSRLETEREFAAEGITTRAGCRWVDSNIRGVLTNITYTGNMLFQKEYLDSPLTKKRKKNHGELPRYWVENTHEAIIDKETFDYVQQEMARRRELGAIANKSIPTTCFTSKLECGVCHRHYVHSMKYSPNGYRQEYWICSSKKDGKTKCRSKFLPQRILERVCAEVMDLTEFDEDVFLQSIAKIIVVRHHELEFHFYDGRVVLKHWVSNLKKESWTEERRKAKAEEMKYNPPHGHCMSGKIRCGKCGETFARQAAHPYKDGTQAIKWRCHGRKNGCDANAIDEEMLKSIYMEISGCDEFSEDRMAADIDHITVVSNSKMVFHFADGREISHGWQKLVRPRPKHTEEYKAYMSRLNKERWTDERRQRMSEIMKTMRKEESYRWQKQ